MTKLGDRYFQLSRFLQFASWFALIFLVKFDTLLEPPVWDTAMGVFPPAIFLYETNFDVLELVKQPDWWEGGANVQSFSLWTWIIALVMSVTHSPTVTFAILHITTFAINAFAISVFVRVLFLYKVAAYLALISGLFLMLIPLVLVQIGYIYTESLVMSFGILAWASWHYAHEGRAVLFALLAVSMKLTGVVILVCISAVLLLRILNKFSLKRLVLLVSMPLALFILISIDGWLGELPSTHGMGWGSREVVFKSLRARLYRTPEITYFICISGVAGLYYLYRLWRLNPDINPARFFMRLGAVNESRLIVLIFTPMFGMGVIAMCYNQTLFLNRYMIPVIPFAITQFVLLAQLIKLEKVLGLMLAIGCIVSIYNHNGVLYRSSSSFSIVRYTPSAAFSIVETSHAYQPYLHAQKKIISEVEKLDDKVPIYVSREVDYMMSHPMMGYVTKAKPNIRGIYKQHYSDISINDFPAEFYVVYSYHGHGGANLKKLIKQATKIDEWDIEYVYEQDIGGYEMYIGRVYMVDELH